MVDKLDVRPGDRWIYETIDDITGETKSTTVHAVTEIRGKTYSVQSAYTPYGKNFTNTVLQVFDETWNLVEDPIWTRKPADPATGIRLPLKIGAQWKTHFTSTRRNPDANVSLDAVTRVVAYEPVMLKFNKNYDAFKLEINEAPTNSGTSSSFVTTKITMWFAPSVNRYVKRIVETRVNDRLQSRNIELLSAYTRRHDDDD